jgi:hypothetical protein
LIARADLYAYWRASLAGENEAALRELRLPTVDGVANGEAPQCGLWKVSHKKGAPKVLMQIWLVHADSTPADKWTTNLTLTGQIGRLPASLQVIRDRWLYAEPATKEEALYWRANERWPSDAPPLPPRTHNAPSDPFEALKVEVEERIGQAEALLKTDIADQLGCDRRRNLQAEILSLAKRADAMHEAEKRPHLEAGRAVDRRFAFRVALVDWSERLRTAFGAWMAAEERRQQEEARRRYEEERAAAEAERARIEAERAQKLADDPVAALTDPAPELPAMPPPPEPVRVRAGGGTGRKAGLRDDWEITFSDYKLAALNVIDDPEISILVGKVILRRVRAAKGRGDWPGVKVAQVRRVA